MCDSGFVDESGVSDNSLSLRTKPSALQSSNDWPSTAACVLLLCVVVVPDRGARVSSLAGAVVVAGGVVPSLPVTSWGRW